MQSSVTRLGAAEHVAGAAGILPWAPEAPAEDSGEEVGSYSCCLRGRVCKLEGVSNPKYRTEFRCIQLF